MASVSLKVGKNHDNVTLQFGEVKHKWREVTQNLLFVSSLKWNTKPLVFG